MGALKHYVNDLICHCAPDDGEYQDAIAWAITTGLVKPTYRNIEADARLIRNKRIAILAAHHDRIAEHEARVQSFGPLFKGVAA